MSIQNEGPSKYQNRMGLFGAAHNRRGKANPSTQDLLYISQSYTLTKKNPKNI